MLGFKIGNKEKNRDSGFSSFVDAFGWIRAIFYVAGVIFLSWFAITWIPGILITSYLASEFQISNDSARDIQAVASILVGLFIVRNTKPR